MIKRALLSLAAAAFLGGALVSWVFWPSSAGERARPTASPAPGHSVTVSGAAVCLPHNSSDGAQTLECATGFKTDGGAYYALRDTTENYSLISQLVFNKHVTISGMLQPQTSSVYDIAGLIVLSAIHK
jgi:outer membrane scaffolding protein for murein synthesis (MipA/OmpV family)